MVGARVNGKLVPIEYVVQNGDRIEVITSQNSKGPSRDWLALVKSTQAKNKINQWFKSELKEDNIVRGKDLIDRYCKTKGINFGDLNKPEFQEKVMQRYAFRDWDSVLASIGHGGLKEGQVINKMIEEREKKTRKEVTDTNILDGLSEMSGNKAEVSKKSKGGIVVKGIHDACGPLLTLLQSGAGRRDRGLCHPRPRRIHSPDRLCEYHQPSVGGAHPSH